MACLVKNCSIKDVDERMIVCWLCHECCHFKCSGLSGLVAEATTKNNGLHWCCESCRKLGVDFYRFFQSQKSKFSEIQNEVAQLNERISAYGKLFNDYKSLDDLKSPIQPSPKRRKSPRNNNNNNNNKAKDKLNVPPAVQCDPTSSGTDVFNTYPGVNTEVISNNPQKSYAEAVLNSVNENVRANNVPLISNTDAVVYNPLRAVAPRKTIFVSRLASDTSVDSVKYYINNKIGKESDTSIQKFNFHQLRSISSFKIIVSADLYEILIKPSFWPVNTLVREYVYRNRSQNVGILPQREANESKN